MRSSWSLAMLATAMLTGIAEAAPTLPAPPPAKPVAVHPGPPPKPRAVVTKPPRIQIFTRAERRAMRAEHVAKVEAATGIRERELLLLEEAQGVVPSERQLAHGRTLGMTPLETAVMTSYTRYASNPLNGAMRSGKASAREHWQPLLEALERGVAKLPRARDVLAYRFEGASDRTWTPGELVRYDGALSVSRKPKPGTAVHLRVRVKDAGDVSSMSAFPGEEELLMWSPTFRVVSRRETPTGVEVELEQLEPAPAAAPAAP